MSSTSMSTRTVLDKAGSSLVNVPCLTNREEFWLLVLLVPLVALVQLIVLGAGEAKGARILDFWASFGDGGEANLVLVICLNCVDRVPLGDPGILGLTRFFGLGAITGLMG